MLATVPAATVLGVRGSPVRVEVFIGGGLPGYRMVGMPDTACRESRDRVKAALASIEREFPNHAITVNLAPATQRKSGAGLDLAIAVGILVAGGTLPTACIEGHAFLGELGLDGSVRAVPGVAPMVVTLGRQTVVVPTANTLEALVAAQGDVHPVNHLGQVVAALEKTSPWPEVDPARTMAPDPPPLPDLADVRGQPIARRALEIAAAGGHHLLLVGSPGSGKTMLAQRLPSLLPPLARQQALEATMIHSAAGMQLPPGGLVADPPFRAPHHTTSVVALVGGGSHQLRPGEVSLACHGVLFLDELGEFARSALEGLREPLEEGVVRVARAAARAVMPARFLLVAATNPCPCGGGSPGSCECDDTSRTRYLRRLSGPLTDRFDLRVVVQRPALDDLFAAAGGEASDDVRVRVVEARRIALSRAAKLNGALASEELDEAAPITDEARSVLRAEMERDRLTGRGYHRIRRVARTIADLERPGSELVEVGDVELALSLRAGLSRHRPPGTSRKQWIA